MAELLRSIGIRGLVALAALLSPVNSKARTVCVPEPGGKVALGFTITHTKVDESSEATCSEANGGAGTTSPNYNIIKNYHRADVRKDTRSILAFMAAEGATAVRTVVWYRQAEDTVMQAYRDPLGLLVAKEGRLPQPAIENLLTFALDVKGAGYRRLYVAIGSLGISSPKCRKKEYGDCYESAFLPQSWSVVEQVVSALRKDGSLLPLETIVDIAPEDCFVPDGPQLVNRIVADFLRYMLTRYRDTFGNGGFVTSCGSTHALRAIPELNGLGRLYSELRVKPAAIDVHAYEREPKELRAVLTTASRVAREVGVPLDIAETYYDDPGVFAEIAALLRAGELGNLRSLLIWPRRAASACQIDVQAPYVLSTISGEVGNAARKRNKPDHCE